jgi:hypothetical protein
MGIIILLLPQGRTLCQIISQGPLPVLLGLLILLLEYLIHKHLGFLVHCIPIIHAGSTHNSSYLSPIHILLFPDHCFLPCPASYAVQANPEVREQSQYSL